MLKFKKCLWVYKDDIYIIDFSIEKLCLIDSVNYKKKET